MLDLDQGVRVAAFDWLDHQRQLHGDTLLRAVLAQGFQLRTPTLRRSLVDVAFVLIWVAAVLPGVAATRDPQWPSELDNLRDISIAQSMLDHRALVDPFYANEAAWYSPLVPALVASGAVLGRTSVPRAFVLLGPWLNALVPLGLYLCGRGLIGRPGALVAAGAFLYVARNPPAWSSATYSPWLFPTVTAEAFFFFAVLAWVSAMKRPSGLSLVVVGVLMGTTFLAHPAAAAVLTGIVILTSPFASTRSSGWGQRLRPAVVPVAVAAILASPFVLPIVIRYGFHVRNRAPASWLWDEVEPAALWSMVHTRAAIPFAVLLLIGVSAVWRAHSADTRRVVAAWGVTALALFVYSLAVERDSRLPALVPAFHFFSQMQVLSWLLAGAGVSALANVIARRLFSRHRPDVAALLCIGVTLVGAAALSPQYRARNAFTGGVAGARVPRQESTAYEWIRRYVPTDAVVLATDNDALRIVGPAGRHVVCVDRSFSNPYVDFDRRASARNEMLSAVSSGDRIGFERAAEPFNVTYVLVRAESTPAIEQHSRGWLRPVFANRDRVLYQFK